MTDIPKKVAEPVTDEDIIPQTVAELPQDTEAPEAVPYVISFGRYNESMCEIPLLTGNKSKKAIETLKLIGTKIRSMADFQRNHIDRIPIRCEGDYRRLFNGLRDDIELKEIKLQQEARIFYFDIEPERTFYVIAITNNHLETNQVRR
ncbi:MAG: hypothetical protein WC246_00945 [Candidatus Paceibacterota bacterium]|jgi:hypothetical protein